MASSEMRLPARVSERRAVEGRDRDRAIVTRNQGPRFLLAETDREHRSFPTRAGIHETRAVTR